MKASFYVVGSWIIIARLAGCATQKTPPQTLTEPASAGTPSASQDMPESRTRLTLADFQLVDELGRPMNVSGQGEVTLPNGTWGRIATDGVVTDSEGEKRGWLHGGRVFDAGGQACAELDPDGIATVDGVELRFDENGDLVGGNLRIKLTPADSPARRAAMLVTLIAVLRPKSDDLKLTPKLDLQRD